MVASSFPKARRFARTPVLFASVQLGNEAQGLILNGSEGGICVQITSGSVGPGLVDLQFQSAAPGHAAAWVGCRGRVIWKSEDRTVAGIEFVDTTPLTNREIKNWLSFGQSLRELRSEWPAEKAPPTHWADDISHEETPAIAFPVEPSSQNADPIENAAPESEPEQRRSQRTTFGQDYGDAMPRFRILRVVAMVLIVLFGAVLLVRLYEPGWSFRNIVSQTVPSNRSGAADHATVPPAANAAIPNPPPAEPPLANSSVASSTPSPNPTPHGEANPIASASKNSGLMLQAGAMTDEQNAKEMAQSLQEKHFPAFVYKKDSDRFFRVFIGPYASDESLRQAQTKLRSLNIPTIKKKSAP